MGCSEDIWTQHAGLLHPATDILFQHTYTNGVLPAVIPDITKRNTQQVLEQYFSKAGISIDNEIPSGSRNGVNLTYTTEFEFIPETLKVCLSGLKLNGNQSDSSRAFNVLGSNQGFTLLVDTNDPDALQEPPQQNECLVVSYAKRMTFNTKGGS